MERSLMLFENSVKSKITFREYLKRLEKFRQFCNAGSFDSLSRIEPPKFCIFSVMDGSIDSGSYMFKGVGNANQHLNDLCGITPFVLDEVTVWGQCGENVVINFETEDGITGTSVGTVVCV